MPDPALSVGSPSSDDNLLRITSGVVRRLRTLPAWDQSVSEIVKELGLATGASRCYVCELREHDGESCSIHGHSEWRGEAAEPHSSDPIVLPVSAGILRDSPVWDQLAEGSSVSELNDCPDAILTYLRSRATQSLVCVPIQTGDRFWGWIGVDDCSSAREWSASVSQSLQLVADAFGAALDHQQSELERERISAILEYSEDAIISKTLDGVVTEWNRGAQQIYGYTRSEMVGQSITRIIPGELHPEFLQIMERLRSGQRIEHHETTRVRKSGERIQVALSISPVYDNQRRIGGAVSIARDVTEKQRAELALRASEERLKLALDAGSIGAWDWHIDTNEVVWSDNMEFLHGLEPGTFDGTFDGFRQGIYAEDYDRVIDGIQRALAGEEGYDLEYRSLRGDDSFHWLATHGSVIRDASGRPRRMTGVCYDITPRKQAEAAQLELLAQVQRARAEADAEVLRLRELFQHAPAMMTLLEGPDHVFVMVNDHYSAAVGHRDILNKPILEAVPELANQGLVLLLDRVYETGETITRSELPVMLDVSGTGDLEERFFTFAYQPFRSADDEITGVLVHAVDLTDHVRSRKRVEQLVKAVASERDRLQQVIDVMPEGVAICDTQGVITLSNLVARQIWGQAQPSGGFESYEHLHPLTLNLEPYPVDELPLTRSVRNGDTVLGEQMIIVNALSGEHVYVLVNAAPLRDGSGEIIGGVVVFQDIRQLREFERQKDEFLQAVTHDLKNPLTTILGNIQLIQRMGLSESERVEIAISNVDSAANRAVALVDEILDLTRLQMGRSLEMTKTSVNLVDLVNTIIDQHQSTTDVHQIRVEADAAEVIGEWDRVRLERVLANLVSNAINYSPEGGDVTIRVRQEMDGQSSTAVVEVQDEGMGIPAQEMSRLFERFWRGSNVRAQVPGTGLGLAGVKAIVEAHDGTIQVASIEGRGSTFTVRLPQVVATPTEV
jgi:PAS domain S-box-containing protein